LAVVLVLGREGRKGSGRGRIGEGRGEDVSWRSKWGKGRRGRGWARVVEGLGAPVVAGDVRRQRGA